MISLWQLYFLSVAFNSKARVIAVLVPVIVERGTVVNLISIFIEHQPFMTFCLLPTKFICSIYTLDV